jgi:hypothetical protein
MRKFPIALTALFMFGGAAHAQCTPEGMARFNANGAQLDAVAARIKAGDCSLIPEWKRLFAVRHAIQHRSQLQTTPYTCRVDIKSPPVPHCGTETAKAAPTPTAPPSPLPVAPAQHEAAAPPPNNSQQKKPRIAATSRARVAVRQPRVFVCRDGHPLNHLITHALPSWSAPSRTARLLN